MQQTFQPFYSEHLRGQLLMFGPTPVGPAAWTARPFGSQLIAITGISTGDEGKGRAIPEYVQLLKELTGDPTPVAMVFKVNGGANSGHTVNGLKLNLIPGGVADRDIPYLGIGRGVVADPLKFRWELLPLNRDGFNASSRLRIDNRTMVSDVTHRLLDLAAEEYRAALPGGTRRGSTGRGITPAFMDETGQNQIFYQSFLGAREDFAARIAERAERTTRVIRDVYRLTHNQWFALADTLTAAELKANRAAIDAGIFRPEEFHFKSFFTDKPFQLNEAAITAIYWSRGQELRGNICDVSELILQLQRAGSHIIGEFGQASMLDKRHGYPPNVTASHTYPTEFFNSAFLPCQPLHTVGVAKAYDTKVGTHVFLTEMDEAHPLGKRLRQMEFGTSTGRQRMVGWFNAVEAAHAIRHGGASDLVFNKLDALTHGGDWSGQLFVCEALKKPDGSLTYSLPSREEEWRTLRPEYRAFAGWSEDISQARYFDQLPLNAQIYVAGMYTAIVKAAFPDGAFPDELPRFRFIGVGPNPGEVVRDIPPPTVLMRMAEKARA